MFHSYLPAIDKLKVFLAFAIFEEDGGDPYLPFYTSGTSPCIILFSRFCTARVPISVKSRQREQQLSLWAIYIFFFFVFYIPPALLQSFLYLEEAAFPDGNAASYFQMKFKLILSQRMLWIYVYVCIWELYIFSWLVYWQQLNYRSILIKQRYFWHQL